MSDLYPYQFKGVRKINHFAGRVVLADDMGLGKTRQALAYIRNYDGTLPAIAIVPAHLKWMWEREASVLGLRSRVLEGTKPQRKGLGVRETLIIVNYDILQSRYKELKGMRAKTVIIDESHYIKTRHGCKRTEFTIRLASHSDHVIAISGTPLLSRPAELWTTLNVVRPDKFPGWWEYAKTYCNPTLKHYGGRTVWEYKGAEHLDQLHQILRRHMMIRRKKEDVLKDLPKKVRTVVPIDVPMKEYYDAQNDFIRWLSNRSVVKAKRAQKAVELTKLGYLLRLAAELKREKIKQWIDDYLESSDSKLVVFGVHKKVIRALGDLYPKIGMTVDGESTKKERRNAENTFQKNPKIRVLFGNITAAGTGLTLTAADHVLFAELDWTPGNLIQAEDRIHRIGQRKTAHIIYMVARNTIEERLSELLQRKQRILDATLDGKTDSEDFNLHQKLLNSFLEVPGNGENR